MMDSALDWLTLVGSLAGIASAVKLFIASRWLNTTQRRFLVAAYLCEHKQILVSKRFDGGIVFHIPIADKKYSTFYDYFIGGGGKNTAESFQNLIYLKELTEKRYFIYNQQDTGINNVKNDLYYLTAKGLRYGRLLRLVTMRPRSYTND